MKPPGSYAGIDRTPGVRLAGYNMNPTPVDWDVAIEALRTQLTRSEPPVRLVHPAYYAWMLARASWDYETAVRNFNAMTAWKHRVRAK